MFVCKPEFRPLTKNLTFKARTHDTKPSPCMKMLGSHISHDLINDREVSQIIPILDNRINQFERLKSYTNFETRLQFSNAYIIGRLVYMMPTYTNFTNQQKDRLHRVLMRTARMTLNSYCFKKSIDYILGCCKWVDIDEMIKSAALKFINNLLLKQKPGELYSKLKVNKRACSHISFTNNLFPKSSWRKPMLLYIGVSYYNQLLAHIN